MKKLLIVLLLLTSLGCSTPKPQIIYETREVEVPVYQIPKFYIPSKPILPINVLTIEDKGDSSTIGKAYVKTVNILEGLVDEMTAIMQGIKKGEQ